MEFNKTVSNPMLVGAMELMKAEDTKEHRGMFMGELTKATLISPALIDPQPQEFPGGEYKIIPGSKIQFPMLSTPDGKKFFMAFTDMSEYEKWVEKNSKFPTFALKFDEYAVMLYRKDAEGQPCPALGFVLNPYGANIIVPRETVGSVLSAKAAMAQDAARKAAAQKAAKQKPEKPEEK